MAREVLAGTTRIKVRPPAAAFLVGLLTGIGAAVYWILTLRDIATFERASAGRTRVMLAVESAVAAVGVTIGVGLQFFGPDESETRIDPITGAVVPVDQGATAIVGLVFMALYVVWLVMAFRMRSHIMRVMSQVGVLPEDRPSAVTWWLCCLLGPVIGTTAAVSHINQAWELFPRYYASIGGTKEAVVATAGSTVAPEQPVVQPLQLAAPAQVAAPVEVAPVSPEARMATLAAGASAGTLTSAESLEYAELVEQVHGAAQAAPWYLYVATHDPASVKAAWWYGVYLVDRGDHGGIALLERVLGNPAYDQWARERIVAFYETRGQADAAARYRAVA